MAYILEKREGGGGGLQYIRALKWSMKLSGIPCV
jgi:hypothetical protein